MTYYELQQFLDKHIKAEHGHEEVKLVDSNNLMCKIKHIHITKNGTDKIPIGLPVIMVEVSKW